MILLDSNNLKGALLCKDYAAFIDFWWSVWNDFAAQPSHGTALTNRERKELG
ncbi:hypothetical protein NIA69_02505 [Gemmiger formicilis]|nr:hypothetical protein [Gemmiger formicilis]